MIHGSPSIFALRPIQNVDARYERRDNMDMSEGHGVAGECAVRHLAPSLAGIVIHDTSSKK